MKLIPFFKMSGNGNDFIIINNINSEYNQNNINEFARKICSRRLSIGADGLIFLEKSKFLDFKWIFLNSDGSVANMCGNGARCVAKYSYLNALSKKIVKFKTGAGIIIADILDNLVRISMFSPKKIKLSCEILLRKKKFYLNIINIGVPHAVIFVKNLKNYDVNGVGCELCKHDYFRPLGINVNFVQIVSKNEILVRTYEKGVNKETLSCGTGNVAVACISAICYNLKAPVFLKNRGGDAKVFFKEENCLFENISLEGGAEVIYSGMLWSNQN